MPKAIFKDTNHHDRCSAVLGFGELAMNTIQLDHTTRSYLFRTGLLETFRGLLFLGILRDS